MMHDRQISDPAIRLRMEWSNSLAFALGECHPEDAAALCVAFLETHETGGPTLGDPFGMVAGDARLWAEAAPLHEVTAFTLAGLERLPKAHLSVAARKRAFVALWEGFNAEDRRAFLSHVDADGRFQGGRAE